MCQNIFEINNVLKYYNLKTESCNMSLSILRFTVRHQKDVSLKHIDNTGSSATNLLCLERT